MADFGMMLRAAGDFGLFQKILLIAIWFPFLLLSFIFASVLFADSDPERHCNTDWILGAGPNLTEEEQLNLTVPREPDGSLSRCLMYAPVNWTLDSIRQYGLNHTTACRDGWVYDQTLYQATIVTDFDLVCDKANELAVAQTVLGAGILIGSLLFGPLGESFGRRRTTQIPVLFLFIFTLTGGLSPNYYLYLASQFGAGMGYGGFRMNAIVLMTEWIGITKRSLGACGGQFSGAAGLACMSGINYLTRDWRLAQLVMAVPMGLAAVYIWFIPESARWLLDRGRTEEAKELILKAAAINRRTVPESLFEKITVNKTVEKGGIWVLIKSPVLRKRFLIIVFAWFAVSLTFICLGFNVGKFGLDIFLTELLFGLTELPAHLLCFWLLELAGRKLCLMFTILVGSLACLSILAVPAGNAIAVTVLAITARILMTVGSSISSVYIQELFPTSARHTAAGLGGLATRVAGLLAPSVNLLVVYHYSIPISVFSSLTLLSGALIFLLPETRGIELADSTAQAEIQR
ncbi:solute carrier family 22 member 13-like isoform X2 [Gadus chalcogrammus]|uniref:solute carrier family 22 member 13-like isoform X2 n=1 Tax=Gadus chalcogrammus TaxID=1042646 RepID=UPI0024C4A1C1|nr:solute carrier family 22 member 13-like isoform X2 [Gadus chalcogrammus]